MDTPTNQPAGIGHNMPDALEALTQQVDELIENADLWSKVKEIKDEEQAGRCSDFQARTKAMLKDVDKKRLAGNKPFRDEIAKNDSDHKSLTGKLEVIAKSLQPLLGGWLIKERERLAEEARVAEEKALKELSEAEELKQAAAETGNVSDEIAAEEAETAATEAIAQADDASKNTRAKVQGNLGGRAISMRTYWSANIIDQNKALEHFRDHPKVLDLIESLANEAARSPEKRKTPIPGVEFVSEERPA